MKRFCYQLVSNWIKKSNCMAHWFWWKFEAQKHHWFVARWCCQNFPRTQYVAISDDGNNNEDTPGVDYECECTADYFGDHCENGRKLYKITWLKSDTTLWKTLKGTQWILQCAGCFAVTDRDIVLRPTNSNFTYKWPCTLFFLPNIISITISCNGLKKRLNRYYPLFHVKIMAFWLQ